MLQLKNLSEDIIIHVAFFLDFDDLWRLRQACTRIRVILSSTPVWRTASSRLALPIRSPSPTTGSCSSSNISGLPVFVQDTWRAAKIDGRWSMAKPYSYIHRSVSQVWSGVRLAGDGRWILCTNDRGDVAATTLTQAINHTIGEQIVYHPSFAPNRGWYGLVGWFRALAVLTVQVESNLRSLNIYCCTLPSLDGSQEPSRLLQHKLDLPGRVTISTIEVCTSSRFLMILCKDLNHEPPWFVDVWSWGPSEDHARQPPQYTMRTVHFEANDCALRIVEIKEGPHVFVVRANKGATYFEFYDLQRHMSNSGWIEPEAQIPVACESLPWSCHQITLPQPRDMATTGNLEDDNPVSVVLCAARSPRLSELLGYRVRLHRDQGLVSLSFLGGYTLPEYSGVIRCVLGPQGIRGAVLVSDPRRPRTELMILALSHSGFRLLETEYSKREHSTPADVTIDEVHGTVAVLGDADDLHILFFDRYMISAK
ncbi:hypothetical protein OPQ81_005634 [Rhizoctonia solani]|nr:hypothetical protein OPQ81_005634 [Rhizoctonia solani]